MTAQPANELPWADSLDEGMPSAAQSIPSMIPQGAEPAKLRTEGRRSVAAGPYRPLTGPYLRCDAARQFGLSLRLQNQGRGKLTLCGQNRYRPNVGY